MPNGLPPGGGGKLENNIGSVPPGALDPVAISDLGSLYNQGDELGVVTDYHIRNHYERDGHIYMMGVTSPVGFAGQTTAFVQLAAPTLLWIADWTGARFLSKPMVPDPTTVGSNWVLMDVNFEAAQIVLSPNGQIPLYRLTGTYVFGCVNPGRNFFSNVSFPVAPWFNSTGLAFLRSISPQDVEQGLLQPVGVGGNGAGGGLVNPVAPG